MQSGSRGGVPQSSSQAPTSGTPEQPGAALVRRPSLAPAVQPIAIDMTQVIGKQVITRSTGRDLGVVSCMWVDPNRGEVVSLDLEEKKSSLVLTTGSGARGGGGGMVTNVALGRLVQIGDVVLVQDEQVLYDQPLDGRYGFLVLVGMEVRTRSGEFLGKVRDLSFFPDTGLVSKIMYDDFGLSFLPSTFFDTFSIMLSDVLSLGTSGIVVSDEAKYRERRETSGLFAAIPSLLRSIGSGGGGGAGNRQVAGLLGTSDPYRQQDGYLPQGYTFEQWESDVRRWEMETGLSYDQYVRSQGQPVGTDRSIGMEARQLPAPQRQAQQPGPPAAGISPGRAFSPRQDQQYGQQFASQQRPQAQAGATSWQQQQQQQQQPLYPLPSQQQQRQTPRPQQRSGAPSTDPRYRTPSPSSSSAGYGGNRAEGQQGRQQQQQQYESPAWQQQQQPGSSGRPARSGADGAYRAPPSGSGANGSADVVGRGRTGWDDDSAVAGDRRPSLPPFQVESGGRPPSGSGWATGRGGNVGTQLQETGGGPVGMSGAIPDSRQVQLQEVP